MVRRERQPPRPYLPPKPRHEHSRIKPPGLCVSQAPGTVVAGVFKCVSVEVGGFRELVERVVPAQGVGPFMKQDLDGFRLAQAVGQPDHKSLVGPVAAAQRVRREPGRPDDDRERRRKKAPKSPQDAMEVWPVASLEALRSLGADGEQAAGDNVIGRLGETGHSAAENLPRTHALHPPTQRRIGLVGSHGPSIARAHQSASVRAQREKPKFAALEAKKWVGLGGAGVGPAACINTSTGILVLTR